MNEESQNDRVTEEAGGYGTPTAEQEMPPGDNKQFAQPREEEAFDAAGLSQDSPEGEQFPAESPDLSQLGPRTRTVQENPEQAASEERRTR